jgi:hypothetical protein
MKKMTCKQLGGACDKVFSAQTFDEIAEMSKQHGKEMFRKGDKEHLKAMEDMAELMTKPKKMNAWLQQKKQEFETLQED